MQIVLFLASLFVAGAAMVVAGVYILSGAGVALIVSGVFLFAFAAIVRSGVRPNV
jgi:hypothetical protein